jgi:hypothetical protein
MQTLLISKNFFTSDLKISSSFLHIFLFFYISKNSNL